MRLSVSEWGKLRSYMGVWAKKRKQVGKKPLFRNKNGAIWVGISELKPKPQMERTPIPMRYPWFFCFDHLPYSCQN